MWAWPSRDNCQLRGYIFTPFAGRWPSLEQPAKQKPPTQNYPSHRGGEPPTSRVRRGSVNHYTNSAVGGGRPMSNRCSAVGRRRRPLSIRIGRIEGFTGIQPSYRGFLGYNHISSDASR